MRRVLLLLILQILVGSVPAFAPSPASAEETLQATQRAERRVARREARKERTGARAVLLSSGLTPTCGSEAADPASLRFSWSAVAGVESYLHCVAKAGAECPLDAVVREDLVVTRVPGDRTQLIPRSAVGDVPGELDELAGQDLVWSVAACAGGRCAYSPLKCPLRIASVVHEPPAGAPAAIAPEDLQVVSVHAPRVELSWTEVERATGYRICLEANAEGGGAGCSGDDAFRSEPYATTSIELELPPSFVRPGALVAWRVGACNRTGCRYSRSARRLSLTIAPPVPVLLSPAADAIATETHPLLSWQAVPGADGYEICVAPPGVGCEESTAIRHRHTGSRLEAELPLPLLPGRVLAWTVAACTAGRCSYAAPRRLIAPSLAAPSVLGPPDQARSGTGAQRFTWEAAPLAEYYRLCAYEERAARARGYGPAQACTELADAQIVNVRATDAELTLLAPDASARQLAWTVAACHHELEPECVYPRSARRLFVEPDHRVTVALESMDVRSSCDQESAGDWVVSVLAASGGRAEAPSIWPASGTRKARLGKALEPAHQVTFERVRPDTPIRVAINVVDCDSDEVAAFRVPLARAPASLGATAESFPVRVQCDGPRRKGTVAAYEIVGTVTFDLTPEQWRAGGKITAVSGAGDCGTGAFTATIDLDATPVATTLEARGPDDLPPDAWR